MDELGAGLWTWTAPHPAWTSEEGGPNGWEQEVRSYAYEADETLVLIDPLAPPSEVDALARDRETAVLLTVHWHRRSAAELVERLGAVVHAPATKVEAVPAAMPYRPGDSLPGGVEARATVYPEEAVLWIAARGAVVFGDVVLGGAGGVHVQPDSWLEKDVTPFALRNSLRPLLDLPVELLLLTHGDAVTTGARDVLERALSGP